MVAFQLLGPAPLGLPHFPSKATLPPGRFSSMAGHDVGSRASPRLPHTAFLHRPSRDVLGAALWSKALPTQSFLPSRLSQGSYLQHGPRPAYLCSLPLYLSETCLLMTLLHDHSCFSTSFLEDPNYSQTVEVPDLH